MRTPALRSSGARASWSVLGLLAAVSLLAAPRAASAQLGKLKRMGADAIKDAAKDKLGMDKKAPPTDAATASGGAKAAGIPMLDDNRIALVLASLAPQVKAAQIRADAAAATAAYEAKQKASGECFERASKTVNPMSLGEFSRRNATQIEALQAQTNAMQQRLNAAMQANDLRKQAYLDDSVTVLTERGVLLTMGATCTREFAPPVVVEARVRSQQEPSDTDRARFDPGEATRGALTRTEYGILRERIALWTLMQANPVLKDTGKEGVFSAEEQAALTKRSAELAKLAPLFKSNAMLWQTWGDLRDW